MPLTTLALLTATLLPDGTRGTFGYRVLAYPDTEIHVLASRLHGHTHPRRNRESMESLIPGRGRE